MCFQKLTKPNYFITLQLTRIDINPFVQVAIPLNKLKTWTMSVKIRSNQIKDSLMKVRAIATTDKILS